MLCKDLAADVVQMPTLLKNYFVDEINDWNTFFFWMLMGGKHFRYM